MVGNIPPPVLDMPAPVGGGQGGAGGHVGGGPAGAADLADDEAMVELAIALR